MDILQTRERQSDNRPRLQGNGFDMERDHSGDATMHRSVRTANDYSHIKGWGADLDRKNRPAYPMERTPPRLEGVHWTHPEDQPITVKVYHSIERPGITPVFGTSTPPVGISGKIRDVAYTYSENDIRHWMLLLLADRVNVVQGLGEDLMSGRIPNIFAEMGGRAELKYNPMGFARKALIASAAIGVVYYLATRRNSRPERIAGSD
jgi:hypothetical protein